MAIRVPDGFQAMVRMVWEPGLRVDGSWYVWVLALAKRVGNWDLVMYLRGGGGAIVAGEERGRALSMRKGRRPDGGRERAATSLERAFG